MEHARDERRLLRRLDSDGLLARAAERALFLADVARIEGELAAALGTAALALGLPEVTMDRLAGAAPEGGARLARVLADVRALAGALREIDTLNAALARRALATVRGYVDALSPAPRAYDRVGSRQAVVPLATVAARG
jgi:hypothetical protein